MGRLQNRALGGCNQSCAACTGLSGDMTDPVEGAQGPRSDDRSYVECTAPSMSIIAPLHPVQGPVQGAQGPRGI